ncbi:Vegetative incompatibility protein HET-E-1 [Colletotrichum orbiculare MAFF 240422]|uniref:Vegetative incompatibility protein HET-E-1 n=1 Tax=Colletotrichum orbiculare (strain 104-T / ATCC 96160 / CBS 514.97 / LARS 414 / MAFF 240422) TaxID=1213857 RepID=A0A484FSN0_COLOR|nr:Vegetative incompatibility protein HET-E-1 [Colletotrichum orbiculare MAFF 240422]
MRLINVRTGRLEEFYHEPPAYAVLSHTWGADEEEISFRDVQETATSKTGVGRAKFDGCCAQTLADGLDYAWIDTCCIDKANSTELSEAINSMFAWYQRASVCYAFLADVSSADNVSRPQSEFRHSRWFERGWTLQELLAPGNFRFYSRNWSFLGTKRQLSTIVAQITGIPRPFLLGAAELREASVAQRMSWAAKRVTKRREDIAYCLLGIFGVTMPMIYGEGDQAFGRLQEEIMRRNTDDSILAWNLSGFDTRPRNTIMGDVISGGILASSPSDFACSGDIVCRDQRGTLIDPLYVFGGHLRIQIRLFTSPSNLTFGLLDCHPKDNAQTVVGIPLRGAASDESSDEYIRPEGRLTELLQDANTDSPSRLIRILDFDGNETQLTWVRVRHKTNHCPDFVVLLELEVRQSLVQARCHVMSAARDTSLSMIASKAHSTNKHTFGKESASNGDTNLLVTLDEERVGAYPMFVVRLASLPEPPPVNVNVTQELAQLKRQTYLRDLLHEDRKVGPQRTVLEKQIRKQSTDLEGIKQNLADWQLRKTLWAASNKKAPNNDVSEKLLVQAVLQGHEATVQFLLDKGSSVELEDGEGHSLLTLATVRKYRGLMRMLVERGANTNSVNNHGTVPLHLATLQGDPFVVGLLLDLGAHIEAMTRNGQTSLSLAAMKGNKGVARLLLDKGANIDAKNDDGWTALHVATSKGSYDNRTDLETAPAALATVRRAAGWHSWAAAASSVSLMMALILQLMQTDRLFLRALQRKEPSFFQNVPRLVTGVGSWIALALQASALVMIGQPLKAIDNQSGSVIQWTMLALGVPSVIVHFAHNRLGYDFDFGGFRASCC